MATASTSPAVQNSRDQVHRVAGDEELAFMVGSKTIRGSCSGRGESDRPPPDRLGQAPDHFRGCRDLGRSIWVRHMSRAPIAALGATAALAAALAATSLVQPAPSEPATKQSGGPLPSIGALKSEYLRCEYISSQRRLSMHGLAFCKAVSDQLLKREFGGDFDLLLAWWSTEHQASAKGIDRQRTSFPAPS